MFYKCVFLIIDHTHIIKDEEKYYLTFKKYWKKIINHYPEFLFIFIQANINQENEFIYDIKSNTLSIKGEESIIPGILYKSLKSIEFIKNHNIKYDYVLRTNLSTFHVIDRFKLMLETLEIDNVLKGMLIFNNFISGTSILLSNNLTDYLMNDINNIINEINEIKIHDDVFISNYLHNLHNITYDNSYMHFLIEDNLDINKEVEKVDIDTYLFRIKTENRNVYDPIYFEKLYNIFYKDI